MSLKLQVVRKDNWIYDGRELHAVWIKIGTADPVKTYVSPEEFNKIDLGKSIEVGLVEYGTEGSKP